MAFVISMKKNIEMKDAAFCNVGLPVLKVGVKREASWPLSKGNVWVCCLHLFRLVWDNDTQSPRQDLSLTRYGPEV